MSESQSTTTPGPWGIKPFDESQTVIYGPEYDDGKHELIATVSVGKHRPNGEGNTRLIASAPMLLEALEILGHRLGGGLCWCDAWLTSRLHSFACHKAHAALAAARPPEAGHPGERS